MGVFWGVDPFRITNKEGSILKKLSQKWVSPARPVFLGIAITPFGSNKILVHSNISNSLCCSKDLLCKFCQCIVYCNLRIYPHIIKFKWKMLFFPPKARTSFTYLTCLGPALLNLGFGSKGKGQLMGRLHTPLEENLPAITTDIGGVSKREPITTLREGINRITGVALP